MGFLAWSSIFRRRYLAVLILSLFGCQRMSNIEQYVAIHESARNAIPVAVEMENLFPQTDHFITHYGFDSAPKGWNTESYFGGRYRLTMQVEVAIDYSANQVKQIGEPLFYLSEISSIQPRNGVYSSKYGRNFRFGLDSWETLYEHDGDFSSIGFVVKTGEVEHFRGYVKAWREPRIPIRLTTD